MVGKYLIGLAPRWMGPAGATYFVIQDLTQNEFNKGLKAALDAGKGVKLRNIKSTGRSNSISTSVSAWDVKLTSVQRSIAGYTLTNITYNY